MLQLTWLSCLDCTAVAMPGMVLCVMGMMGRVFMHAVEVCRSRLAMTPGSVIPVCTEV